MNLPNRVSDAMWFVSGCLLAVFVAGCAPVVLPPSQHATTTADQVNLYKEAPPKYELLGLIRIPITAEMKWDEYGQSIAGIDAIKAKGAAMGANGVLFVGQPGTFDL